MDRWPQWLTDMIETLPCSHCGQTIDNADLVAAGFRKDENGEIKFCIENKCEKCNQRSFCIVDISIADLIDHMTSEFDSGEIPEYNRRNPTSPMAKNRNRRNARRINKDKPITDGNVVEFKKQMDKIDSDIDLLRYLGVPEKDINED